MTLDLNELVSGWDCPKDELAARLVPALDGSLVVQLRVDAGLLQMCLDGRPDGKTYRGATTVLDFVRAELDRGQELGEADWNELQRELNQFNYRRMALSSLADEILTRKSLSTEEEQIGRALRDIDHCLRILRTCDRWETEGSSAQLALLPTLVFNRTRLLGHLLAAKQDYDAAIDEIQVGAAALCRALEEIGVDAEQCDKDPGIGYLQQLATQLREQHGIPRTLKEQLADAIAAEDFETAAKLRDRLRQRGKKNGRGQAAPET